MEESPDRSPDTQQSFCQALTEKEDSTVQPEMRHLRCVMLVRNGRGMKQFAEKLSLHFAIDSSTHGRPRGIFCAYAPHLSRTGEVCPA